jgi:membrane protease subunit HflC
MSARAAILVLAALALLGWIASQTFYIVQQDQLALLMRLGKPVATIAEPGLNAKIPFIDTVVVYDKHLLALQPPLDQIILGDQKRIEVTTFLRFRIDNPLRFYQSVGTEEQARINLAQIVSSTARKQLGKVALPALLTEKRDQITDRIRDEVATEASALGVIVTDVRILRAELPAETSQAIYDRMTSERVREAKELRAQGFEAAQQIRSKADRDRAVLLSDALRASQTERGVADAEANTVAVSAYGRDAEFYDLYRTLQVYRSSLTQGAPVLVLAPSSELMKYFDAGPNARKPATQPPALQSQPPAKEREP